MSTNCYNLNLNQVEKRANKEVRNGWTFKWQREHTEPVEPLNRKNADVSQSQIHMWQSGVSIMYCRFDDAQLENTKAINPAIHKCSIRIA